MITDFLGNELKPGDTVVKVSRNGAHVRLAKRTVQSVEDDKLVLEREDPMWGEKIPHKNIVACDPRYCLKVSV